MRGASRRMYTTSELREVALRRISERELARVAKLHDRRRGERLAHRANAKHAVGVDGRARLHVAEAVTFRPREVAVDNDSDGQPGTFAFANSLAK